MSHRLATRFPRSLWSTPLLCCYAACMLTIIATPSAQAQCTRHPGDFLVGEDDDYYYCESPASSADIEETLRDIEKYLTRPPSAELLGARWLFRKSAIDTAGCVARNHAAYQYGAKYSVLNRCANGKPIDCSGLAGYAYRVSACFVRGFYSAKDDVLRQLADSADGQAKLFKTYGAWMDINAVPSPGDAPCWSLQQ